jgi:hypothetical protein
MFLAGLISGLTSGARGAGAGTLNALTTWGLVAIAVAVVVVPTFSIGHVPTFVTVNGHTYKINYLTYWTAFWGVLIGLGAALLGGLIGGVMPRRSGGPYLDLSRATATETAPVVDRRVPVAQQPAPATAQTAAVTAPAAPYVAPGTPTAETTQQIPPEVP